MNKILVLTSGNASKLNEFSNSVDKASLNDIWFSSSEELYLNNNLLNKYRCIYFRMVGKSLEVATLIVDYAIKNNIRIIDKIYTKSNLMPASLGKSIELNKLIQANIPVPKTIFNKFDGLPFPFVVKSTTSSRAREVWLVKNADELNKLKSEKIIKNKFYFIQEFIPNAKRARVLVIGDRAIGGILRQTKWNKDKTKVTLNPVPSNMAKLALTATKAVGLEICGVDLLIDNKNKLFVIETNAAPSWKLINKYCGIAVEDEIIKYIQRKI